MRPKSKKVNVTVFFKLPRFMVLHTPERSPAPENNLLLSGAWREVI